MGEKPNEIMDRIEAKRDELESNLDTLEDRIRSAADWRRHYDERPMAMLGLAFGGGLLLSAMIGGWHRRPRYIEGDEYDFDMPPAQRINLE